MNLSELEVVQQPWSCHWAEVVRALLEDLAIGSGDKIGADFIIARLRQTLIIKYG